MSIPPGLRAAHEAPESRAKIAQEATFGNAPLRDCAGADKISLEALEKNVA
jgi:hypothetical protein